MVILRIILAHNYSIPNLSSPMMTITLAFKNPLKRIPQQILVNCPHTAHKTSKIALARQSHQHLNATKLIAPQTQGGNLRKFPMVMTSRAGHKKQDLLLPLMKILWKKSAKIKVSLNITHYSGNLTFCLKITCQYYAHWTQ